MGERSEENLRRGASPWITRALAVLCLIWLAVRFLPSPDTARPLVESQLAAVRAHPSAEKGRWEVRGLERAGADPEGLARLPSFAAEVARLEAAVEAVNDDTALFASRSFGAVEVFPDDGVTGIRLGGLLVPFYDQDADRLAWARRDFRERPWDALQVKAEILENRLSEPQEGFLLEDSTQRRDLTRMLREIEDLLGEGGGRVSSALETFRAASLEAARRAEGPFHRSGRGRILEILLAAWLGATLAEALRRERPGIAPAISLAFAPVLACAAVLLLEGTSLLPVDPVRGLSLAFLPISFGLGFSGAGLLGVASRLDRLLAPTSRAESIPALEARPRPASGPAGTRAPALARATDSSPPRPTRGIETLPAPARDPSPRPARPVPSSEREVDEDPVFRPRIEPDPDDSSGVPDPQFRTVSEFLERQTEETLPFFPKRKRARS